MQSFQQQNETTSQNSVPIPIQVQQANVTQELIATTEQIKLQRLAELRQEQRLYRQMPVQDALQNESPVARAEAQTALQDMTRVLNAVVERKRNVDAMMAQLLRETRLMRARQRLQMAERVALALAFLALIFFTHGRILHYWWFFLYGGGAISADRAVSKRHEAAHALSKAGEPRVVGVLAIAMRDGNRYVRSVADSALRQLLPRVQASDAAFIAAEQMTALLDLAERGDERMQIAVLKALEQIGDERALPIVEQLAASPFSTPAVRDQARACLPFLSERIRHAREQATLLRGASAPTAAVTAEHLLRPASATTDTTPADQLLRATQPQ